jgi:hypothetical protein
MAQILDPEANNRAITAYETADRELSEFLQQNADFMEHLRMLTNRRNEALQVLEDRARHLGDTLGPVQKKGTTFRADAEQAVAVLGEEVFSRIGGEIVRTPQLKIDQLREAMRSGQVSRDNFDKIAKGTPTFTGPRRMEVP